MPSGTLRISLPFTVASALVVPMLPRFMAAFPQVRVDLMIEDGIIDMPAELVDMVIRVGALADSALIARHLLTSHTWLCASPAYFAARGTPIRATDLHTHSLIDYGDRPVTYRDGAEGRESVFERRPNAIISDSAAILPAVLGGCGIARLPDFLVKALVEDGRLVRLWPEARTHEVAIHALYPSHRALSAKVIVLTDPSAKALKGNATV